MQAADLQEQVLLAQQRQTILEREIATLRDTIERRDDTIRELRTALTDIAQRAEVAARRQRA